MGAEIDRLEVAVEANARSANSQLDKLVSNLTRVCTALQTVNTGGLQGLSNGIRSLSSSMNEMKSVGTADFTRLTKNLERMSGINTSAINKAASSMSHIGKSLNGLSSAASNSSKIVNVASSIAKFGSVNTQRAIANIPLLSRELKEMMRTLASAPTVSSNVIKMTQALASLAAQGSRTSSAANGLKSSLSSYSVYATKAKVRPLSLASVMGKLYANFWVLQRAMGFLWKSANSAMDFAETVNYYEVAMRQIGDDNASQWKENGYKSAETYADSFRTRLDSLNEKMTGFSVDIDGNAIPTNKANLGLDIDRVMNAEATYGQMANSLGVVGETAINTSKALTMLGTDWASLKNISFDQAWEKFASALAGQSRAVRSLGIDITNTTLQEYAYRYGLTESISEMNQATKTQLRLLAILDQSKVAFGDLANTINSPANQLRMLKNNISVLGRTIGNLFIPIIERVLPYINGLVIALQRLFVWIGKIFGINLKNINSSIGGSGNAMSDLTDDTDDFGNTLDDATKKAKKLKNVLGSYDELNILKYESDDDSDKSDSKKNKGGNAALDKAIAAALADYDKAWDDAFKRMNNKAEQVADAICNAFKRKDYKGIGTYISEGIADALDKIDWNKVYSVARNFGSGFAEFLNGLISPHLFSSVGKTIAGALNTAIYAALSFGENFDWDNLGNSIAAGINSFFENFDFKAFGKTINVWVQGLAKAIRTAIKKIKWKDVWKGLTDFLCELDVDTVAILIGAFALKYAGKILTSSILKSVIASKLSSMIGGSSLGAITGSAGGALATGFVIAATVYVSFKFAEDAKKWWDNIQKYGWNEGRKKTADENPANPYNNGRTVNVKDISNPYENGRTVDTDELSKKFENLKQSIQNAYEESNKWAENNRNSVINWFEETNRKSDEWASGNREKLSQVGSDISQWWTNDVSPWFTAEKWKELFSNIGNSLNTEWDNISSWWENSTLVVWWANDVSPWFTKEKWSNLYSTVKSELSTKWTGFSTWWKSNGVSKWWNEDVRPFFSRDKWTFGGIKEGLKKAFENAITTIKQVWNNFANYLNGKLKLKWDGVKVKGKTVIPSGSVDLGKIPTFSTGGFPEDGLFFANRGELLGNFSNGKTAVANNGQIIEGIKAGVTEAMMDVLMATSSQGNTGSQPIEIPIYLDGREVARGTYENIEDLIRCGQIVPKFV